jgi:hypothetical protein
MKSVQHVLVLAACLFPYIVHAQYLNGKLIDIGTDAPIELVYVSNQRTGMSVYSDSAGTFSMQVAKGDKLIFMHPAYKTYSLTLDDVTRVRYIKLVKNAVQLREVEVLSDMAKYKRDSAYTHSLYKKVFKDTVHEVKRDLLVRVGEIGFTYEGLISKFAWNLSKKKKHHRRFTNTLAANERERFTNIRYNNEAVSYVTGASDSLAGAFINAHPIEYDFVRTATDLELRAWIKNEYKNWLKH